MSTDWEEGKSMTDDDGLNAIAEGLLELARQVQYVIGNGSSSDPRGAIEVAGSLIKEGLDNVADAIRERGGQQ